MHNALAHPRLHHPKARLIGIYAPDGPTPPRSIEQTGKDNNNNPPKKPKSTINIHPDACVYVPNPKGQYFKTVGQADSWGRVWLLPEEALYLVERGSLDIRWPCSVTGEEGDGASELPMSLQAAYTSFIGRGGLAVERYSVYTGLRRLGYAVVRAPGWYENDSGSDVSGGLVRGPPGLFARFWNWFYSSDSTVSGPVIGLGIHRSYSMFSPLRHITPVTTDLVDDIYRKLALIPWYNPVTNSHPVSTPNPKPTAPYRIVFHVYKPSGQLKKTALPPPDFRLAVIDARSNPTMPTLSQLSALLETTPLDPPRGEKMERMLYMRLKHGYRNVILAVVDQGVVSYLRVSDAVFGKERIYERAAMFNGNKGRFRGRSNGR